MAYLNKKRRERPWDKKRKQQKDPDYDFYNSREWRTYRADYLTEFPLCVECQERGEINEAVFLDHRIRIKDEGSKWDPRNHGGLCEKDHNIKRGKERHGFIMEWELNEDGERIPKQN